MCSFVLFIKSLYISIHILQAMITQSQFLILSTCIKGKFSCLFLANTCARHDSVSLYDSLFFFFNYVAYCYLSDNTLFWYLCRVSSWFSYLLTRKCFEQLFLQLISSGSYWLLLWDLCCSQYWGRSLIISGNKG